MYAAILFALMISLAVYRRGADSLHELELSGLIADMPRWVVRRLDPRSLLLHSTVWQSRVILPLFLVWGVLRLPAWVVATELIFAMPLLCAPARINLPPGALALSGALTGVSCGGIWFLPSQDMHRLHYPAQLCGVAIGSVYLGIGLLYCFSQRSNRELMQTCRARVTRVSLWPIIVLMRQLGRALGGQSHAATEQRAREILRLPPCSETLLYDAVSPWGQPLCGRYVFKAADVEELAKRIPLRGDPASRFPTAEHVLLYNWLRGRQRGNVAPVQVPRMFALKFAEVVADLVADNKASVFCAACGAGIVSPDPCADHFDLRSGPNDNSYQCPQGHILFSVRRWHAEISEAGAACDTPKVFEQN